MKHIDLLISARWLYPVIPSNTLLDHHSIAIDHGVIIDILPTDKALKQYQPHTHNHLNNHLIMPGLINTHTHSPMTLFRGLADDLPLHTWLHNHIWPAEQQFINTQSVHDGTSLAIAEMIYSGTTCFFDNYFFPETIAHCAESLGVRAHIGICISNTPTQWASSEQDYLYKAEKLLKNQPDSNLATYALAPHAPYTTTNQTLTAIAELSNDYDCHIQIHLHETEQEIIDSINQFGVRPITRLNQLKLLSPNLSAVHMTHTNLDDLKICQDTNLSIIHCPESNLKLGGGIAPVDQFIKHNINIGLGTDGAASNNDLDMFSELKLAALLSKGSSLDPTSCPAFKALEMATINGAKAIGMEHLIGSLEINKLADIIAIDMSATALQPIYHPISHLVYAANQRYVSDVWVNGNQLLKNKHIVSIDTETIKSSAQAWADKIKQFD